MPLYSIADFTVEITPRYGEVAELLSPYAVCGGTPLFSICLSDEQIAREMLPDITPWQAESAGTCRRLAERLLAYGGYLFHAAVVELDGVGYAFTAKSGVGKTTHVAMWMKKYGAAVINGDKPILRERDGKIYAYGTPWCGKENWQRNTSVPLGALCFLARGEENAITRLAPSDALPLLLPQLYLAPQALDFAECFVTEVPAYRLYATRSWAAAELSYQTMKVK
ncbi:MAG: hypothetical protein IJW71_01590 [Clostridia bacterium]|nr:hypothetical protein [Clostridia bacterium]